MLCRERFHCDASTWISEHALAQLLHEGFAFGLRCFFDQSFVGQHEAEELTHGLE
jgi:hypothetical protein